MEEVNRSTREWVPSVNRPPQGLCEGAVFLLPALDFLAKDDWEVREREDMCGFLCGFINRAEG